MQSVYMGAVVAVMFTLLGFFAGRVVTHTNAELEMARHMAMGTHGDHAHEPREVGDVVPDISLMVHTESDGSTAVSFELENFTLTPEKSGGEHVEGEGHIHLYVDGIKVARVYGVWHHLGVLPASTRMIAARLATNDHRELVQDGVPIEAMVSAASSMCPEDSMATHTVCYTKAGYHPYMLEVAVGDSVAFVALEDAPPMWTASDEHPSHTEYGGTSIREHCDGDVGTPPFDQCGVDAIFRFTFTEPGTWGYHNHSRSSHHGTILVE